MTRPGLNLCTVCRHLPEAITHTGYCFGCWPGGPVTPPPCLVCGSPDDYYNTGKCRRCHIYGQPPTDSCPDCLAWGTTRLREWLCHACHGWRDNHPTQDACRTCHTPAYLHTDLGICRLCFAHARHVAPHLGRFDPDEANRTGQQLFIAQLTWQKGSSRKQRQAEQHARTAPSTLPKTTPNRLKPLLEPPLRHNRTASTGTLPRYEQLAFFPAHRDHARLRQRNYPWPTDPTLLHHLWKLADAHATRLGWSSTVRTRTRSGLRIVLGLQDDPGAPITRSSLEFLADLKLTTRHVAAVLDEAGLLIDDHDHIQRRWLEERITHLPEQMADELRIWRDVMAHGRPHPPRRRPRTDTTIRLLLKWAHPTLTAWAAHGHTTLRTITREDVTTAMQASDLPARTGQSLRSLFQLLKQDHVLFADPTQQLPLGHRHSPSTPLPLDTAAIKALLDQTNPARAAVAAVVAFHALSTSQVCNLQLAHITAGHLHIDDRTIPLAPPVRDRITAYLNHRNATWPHTANPHLFINRRSAMDTGPVGRRWIKLLLGPDVSCRSIREDRILAEALANRADAKRLHDLFGLSIEATHRYTKAADQSALTP
ncbi:hypothetical protein ACIPJS_37705 [Streptomyces sp. NPDC086783]|uniref:hypothetical protein n=1 Tax=Streptomyces sp. NPDC086783 TaxID=3365758 RepID=UPI00382AE711